MVLCCLYCFMSSSSSSFCCRVIFFPLKKCLMFSVWICSNWLISMLYILSYYLFCWCIPASLKSLVQCGLATIVICIKKVLSFARAPIINTGIEKSYIQTEIDIAFFCFIGHPFNCCKYNINGQLFE